MNGPEHYTEAEKLLTEAANTPACWDGTNPSATILLAEAQVHATLALAAAQADQVVADALSHPNWVNASAWEVAIQHVPAEGEPF
jgi:hypothetical protein